MPIATYPAVTKRASALVTTFTAVLTIALGFPSVALASPTEGLIQVTTQSAAGDVAASVKSFRTSMISQLNDYLTEYGPRLNEAERMRVNELVSQSDQDLARLSALASTTADWDRRRNRARALRAARAASMAFDASYARAEAAIAELTPILKPHLNMFEALDAQAALDQRMAAYRNLGGRIKGLSTNLR